MKLLSPLLAGIAALLTLPALSALSAEPAPRLEQLAEPTTEATHQLVWQTEAGRSYSVESSENLGTWTPLDGFPVQATGSSHAMPLKLDQTRMFYRIVIHPQNVPDSPEGFVFIPAGTFTMGSPEDEAGRSAIEIQHQVTLTLGFHMKSTEVTFNEWTAIRAQGPALGYTDLPAGGNGFNPESAGEHPVTNVAWWDVIKWCNLRSEIEGKTPVYHTAPERTAATALRTGTSGALYLNWEADGYRLPTEAEWEYACRAGTTTAFYTGDLTNTGYQNDPALTLAGWYGAPFISTMATKAVAGKQANAFGLFDTHGNVSEWCWDLGGAYTAGAETDPRGPVTGTSRVHRGGAFFSASEGCRSAARAFENPAERSGSIGFRPVATAAP